MDGFWSALLLSTGVIFVAELGDKSQLMAMTFASRYRARDVLIGITVATAVVHLASVAVGFFIGDLFAAQQHWIAVAAGLAFLGFAIWTLRGDELSDEEADSAHRRKGRAIITVGIAFCLAELSDAEASRARRSKGSAIIAVGVAFMLAELGDKTMLATVALATQEDWVGTWIGSTVGMVLADALAIVVGAVLGRKLPERVIKFGAAILFALFGLTLIAEGIGVF